MKTLLVLLPVTCGAFACNQSVYNTNDIVTYQQGSFFASAQNGNIPAPNTLTPSVGHYADYCEVGQYAGYEIVAVATYYMSCGYLTTEIGMDSQVNHITHVFPWDGPTNWSMTSFGTVTGGGGGQHVEEQWSLIADCDCYPYGTMSDNGGFDHNNGC